MATLTAANSVILLGVVGLFPVPQQLQGFATDDVFATDAVETVETMMGVDGGLSAGWVPTALQADSGSNGVFDAWYAAQEVARETFAAFGEITLPAIGKKYEMVRGFLTSYSPIPETKKVLQPRKYTLTWQRIVGTPL